MHRNLASIGRKAQNMHMRKFGMVFIGLLLLSACGADSQKIDEEQPDLHSASAEQISKNAVPQEARDTANNVLAALKSGNWQGFASYVHPEKGVRFTPYTRVKLDSDAVMQPTDVAEAFASEKQRNWGVWDGTGKPLILEFSDYYKRYIWNQNYIEAPIKIWNQPCIRGNSLDNASEAYPDAHIVEYHFPGFDPQYNGMDWSSLRLALEKYNSEWRIVGLIHDEWTI